MIFVDASAIVAILADEPGGSLPLEVLAKQAGSECFTNPVAVYEAALAITRIRACDEQVAEREVRYFLEVAEITIDRLNDAHAAIALSAFSRFGKGVHRAALNMGDCFAYASAKLANASILFVGDDFNQTDLPSAS
jgi:ribonuclease VapC